MAEQFDVIILGSGPGGYVAAIRAAQLGLRVAIVERELLGGICLNWGCIPTKALLRSSEVFNLLRHAESYGLSAGQPAFDLEKVVQRSRDVARQLNRGVTGLMKKNDIAVFFGTGTITSRGRVVVDREGETSELAARDIIVATGARARELSIAPSDDARIWTYRTAMTPPEMPTDLLVIGSGAIGIEFASFFNDLGAKVTIVEMQDRILPVEDAEISEFMSTALTRQGMDIRTSASLRRLESHSDGVEAEIEAADGTMSSERFSHAIVAVGIVPNTEGIGLEDLGVATDRGHIVTDAACRTNVEGIYAIGDVAGAPWLAHKASHEGIIAVEAIAGGHTHVMDRRNIPGCTYCHPQVASVGLTEAQAAEAGYETKVGRFPFIGNGKAIALGEAEGFVKTVFDTATGELLGAHMAGPEVTELIQGFVMGKTLEATEIELMATVFPHPTIGEAMHESVLAAFGRPLHI